MSGFSNTNVIFFKKKKKKPEIFTQIGILVNIFVFWGILVDELSQWIQMSFKHYAMQEAKQQFVEYDKNSDGAVTWDEYNIQMYDRVIDFDENTALDDTEEGSFRQVGPCCSREPEVLGCCFATGQSPGPLQWGFQWFPFSQP